MTCGKSGVKKRNRKKKSFFYSVHKKRGDKSVRDRKGAKSSWCGRGGRGCVQQGSSCRLWRLVWLRSGDWRRWRPWREHSLKVGGIHFPHIFWKKRNIQWKSFFFLSFSRAPHIHFYPEWNLEYQSKNPFLPLPPSPPHIPLKPRVLSTGCLEIEIPRFAYHVSELSSYVRATSFSPTPALIPCIRRAKKKDCFNICPGQIRLWKKNPFYSSLIFYL